MTRPLPPLDLHAHIDPGVPPSVLEDLGAVVFAVTRSPSEFAQTAARTDKVTVWGAGCHPGNRRAHGEMTHDVFDAMLDSTAFVGEIGLDAKSRVPYALQRESFTTALAVLTSKPRIASIHSTGATEEVLDAIEAAAFKGAVLHWWLSSPQLTQRALSLGCYFSLNHAMVPLLHAIDVPMDRVFVETDHPFGDRDARRPRHPGAVSEIETAVAQKYQIDVANIRHQQWRNLTRLSSELSVTTMFPAPIRRMLDHAGG